MINFWIYLYDDISNMNIFSCSSENADITIAKSISISQDPASKYLLFNYKVID
jgi:hypothetical protein